MPVRFEADPDFRKTYIVIQVCENVYIYHSDTLVISPIFSTPALAPFATAHVIHFARGVAASEATLKKKEYSGMVRTVDSSYNSKPTRVTHLRKSEIIAPLGSLLTLIDPINTLITKPYDLIQGKALPLS